VCIHYPGLHHNDVPEPVLDRQTPCLLSLSQREHDLVRWATISRHHVGGKRDLLASKSCARHAWTCVGKHLLVCWSYFLSVGVTLRKHIVVKFESFYNVRNRNWVELGRLRATTISCQETLCHFTGDLLLFHSINA